MGIKLNINQKAAVDTAAFWFWNFSFEH